MMRYSLRMGYSCESLSLCQDLLGFQQGCLSAPQEVSTWTKFCEVDIQTPLGRTRIQSSGSIYLFQKSCQTRV